ncbi:MAG: SRPBCC family protein [Candidatus Binataceae bacterium]
MKWPNGMEPGSVAVYARNEIEIAAAPERVWRWLIGGERWPQWYGNCSSFRYTDKKGGPDLAVGRSFEWRTFGTRVSSVVRTFEPCYELGWDARARGLYAYHGWILDRRRRDHRSVSRARRICRYAKNL